MSSGTRAQVEKALFNHVVDSILELDLTAPLRLSFSHEGLTTLASILELSDNDRSELQYVSDDTKSPPTISKIRLNDRNILWALQACYPHMCRENGSLVNWLTLTADEFQAYRISSAYDPNSPVVPYASQSVLDAKAALANASLGNTGYSPKEAFLKGIKRDKTHYQPFKNEKQWDNWNRHFRATARTHVLQNILDHNYVPQTTSEQELFLEQQAFMYSVLESVLLTDYGKTIVRKYEVLTDAQKIYEALVIHMTSSSVATTRTQTLLEEISSAKMHTSRWNGSRRTYILAWADKVRQYNACAAEDTELPDPFCKTLLQSVVARVTELNQLKVTEQVQAQLSKDTDPLGYQAYLKLVLEACDHMDQSAGLSTQSPRHTPRRGPPTTPQTIRRHETLDHLDSDLVGQDTLDDYDATTEIYTTRRYGPSLNRQTWNALSSADQTVWDQLSPEGKSTIISFQRNRDTTNAPTPTPNPEPTQPVTILAHERNITPEPDPTPVATPEDHDPDPATNDRLLVRAAEQGISDDYIHNIMSSRRTASVHICYNVSQPRSKAIGNP